MHFLLGFIEDYVGDLFRMVVPEKVGPRAPRRTEGSGLEWMTPSPPLQESD